METVHQFSAGGVVQRAEKGRAEIVLIKTSSEGRWQLPKGIIDPGETPEIAAVREVREEAGVAAEIVEPLDDIEYWFVAAFDGGPKKRYHKKVRFFQMRFIEGNTNDHDREVSEAKWVSFDEAQKMLAFDSERELVAKAKSRVEAGE